MGTVLGPGDSFFLIHFSGVYCEQKIWVSVYVPLTKVSTSFEESYC
jgi:hypothetical protein